MDMWIILWITWRKVGLQTGRIYGIMAAFDGVFGGAEDGRRDRKKICGEKKLAA